MAYTTFNAYSRTRSDMDGKTFAKLCKDCNLVDKSLTAIDIDIVFAKVVPKGLRRIGYEDFNGALALLAEKKGVSIDQINYALNRSQGPVMYSSKVDAPRQRWTVVDAMRAQSPGGRLQHTGRELSPDRPHCPRRSSDVGQMTQQMCQSTRASLSSLPEVSRKGLPSVEHTFKVYCGRSIDMDGKTFFKLCKDCALIDASMPATEVDIIFAKVNPRGHRRMCFESFECALRWIALKKDVNEMTVRSVIQQSQGPVLHCTKADVVRLHDDKSTYTGTHCFGGPEAVSKAYQTPREEAFWRGSLRHDSEVALPDMMMRHMRERAPSNLSSKAISEVPVRRRAPKTKPPGEADDVTMVFTDVQGSTSLWEACPSAMEHALRLHDATMRKMAAKHQGYEVTTEGDAFQIAFHDPLDAVGFCLDVQTELMKCNWPAAILQHKDACVSCDNTWKGLRVRMGAHTGRPAHVTKHEVTGRVRYAGLSVVLAKAIEDVCNGGQILLSAACFSSIDGQLTQLGSPQVVDLGEHVLKAHGLNGSLPGQVGTHAVHLLQLTPASLAYDYFMYNDDVSCVCGSGRLFDPITSMKQTVLGFDESPSGPSVTLCFAFTQGGKDLAASMPDLADTSLGLLRQCVRSVLRDSKMGYECQEDEGAFMLAFKSMEDAAAVAAQIQVELSHLPWPAELTNADPRYSEGLRMAIGVLSGAYTSRGPHASTGRSDYFGPIVNRAARIAAAAHAGQVLLGAEVHASEPPVLNLPSGAVLNRLGAFSLKGIDCPIVLHELSVPDAAGQFATFPPAKTKGRVGD